jgi:hypothetical protein
LWGKIVKKEEKKEKNAKKKENRQKIKGSLKLKEKIIAKGSKLKAK